MGAARLHSCANACHVAQRVAGYPWRNALSGRVRGGSEMYDFHYHRPKSLADAVGLLKGKDEARPMSGGMTLIPTLKQRLAKPSDVVDLGGIKELAATKVEGNTVLTGGMTRHPHVAPPAHSTSAHPPPPHLPRP